jgi:putative lipoic acid-binding regulatory protein
MDRAESLDLLRSQHQFPGVFEFRVVIRPGKRSTVVSAMTAAAGPGARLEGVRERNSRNGNYVALRVGIDVDDAERVLDVYEVLKALDGILAVM